MPLRSRGTCVTCGGMKITLDDVRHVAALARLDLSDEEQQRLVGELGAILEHVETLRALDTDDVPPTAHLHAGPPALRADEVANSPQVDALLANAPDRWESFFRVPKIIE